MSLIYLRVASESRQLPMYAGLSVAVASGGGSLVSADMPSPVAPSGERCAAHLAGVGLFARVRAHVQLEVLCPLARFPAGWARVHSLIGRGIGAAAPRRPGQRGLPPAILLQHLKERG